MRCVSLRFLVIALSIRYFQVYSSNHAVRPLDPCEANLLTYEFVHCRRIYLFDSIRRVRSLAGLLQLSRQWYLDSIVRLFLELFAHLY